jgi:uncharacterized repeat protein (TIGR03806 family)
MTTRTATTRKRMASAALVLLTWIYAPAGIAAPGLTTRPANPDCVAPDPPQTGNGAEWEILRYGISYGNNTVLYMAQDDQNRWFTITRHGIVDVYDGNAGYAKVGTALDITDRVTLMFEGGGAEFGALSIALDPDFANNGEAYVYYTTGPEAPAGPASYFARVSRFTSTDGTTFDPNSEEILLAIPLTAEYHVGATIGFGPDGYLYAGTGEGFTASPGVPGAAQDPFDLRGKFLRIDVHGSFPYDIPPDNPFADGVSGAPEVWAMGFRNPFRWSFDSATGDLWVGDVGSNETEEVNIVVKGGNYGWGIVEGTSCWRVATCDQTGLIPPAYSYPHESGSNAIVGGIVYRGSAFPSLQGHYLFGDRYHSGLQALSDDGAGGYTAETIADQNSYDAFIEGSDGELYMIQGVRFGWLVPTAGGQPPLDPFPDKLSETGCVDPNDPTQPGPGLIPYSVNNPLWSDGAVKDRWMAIPDGETVQVDANGDFVFPNGTVLVKNFAFSGHLVETRLMMRHDDGTWAGYTYEWDDAQTDATLLDDTKTISNAWVPSWTFPSRDQCLQCHTSASGWSLGPEIAQLNSDLFYPSSGLTGNQLETLEFIGVFDAPLPDVPAALDALPSIDDLSAPVDERARAYLHSNCSICHRPGGPGQGPEDFRYYIPGQSIGAYDVEPTQGDFGIADARLIYPGDPSKSILHYRIGTLGTGRMPPLASIVVHQEAVDLIGEWIASGQGFGFPDTDGDGFADNVDPDIDGDGMPNDWETANMFDPLDPTDANIDSDGDGVINVVEFQDGTDPHDPDDFGSPSVPTASWPWLFAALFGAFVFQVFARVPPEAARVRREGPPS